ncbi:hypothetical protein MUP56_00415, partial [Patescibacteria group bacterium]|nr:hypothetical protein [Patescibacteria group bacterium]
YVTRHGTIAVGNMEKAMSATSEQRKLQIRQYANKQFLDVRGTLRERAGKRVGRVVAHNIGHFLDYMSGSVGDRITTTPGTIEQWLQNRVEGTQLAIQWRENELNSFYINNILRPGAKFENIDPWIQGALGQKTNTQLPMSKADWSAIPEGEKMQLRSMVVLEHITMRYNATGEMPTILEQRILISQPWSNELIKAGVIGNPEFVEHLEVNVPDVTPEAIKNNDPAAMAKVREAATKNRIMGLVLFGLSAASAASAFTKEEKRQ